MTARPIDPATAPRITKLLTDFAIWFSVTWQEDNEDDRAAAEQWVKHFLDRRRTMIVEELENTGCGNVRAVLEGDAKVELGARAKEALRVEQVIRLREAFTRLAPIVNDDDSVPPLDEMDYEAYEHLGWLLDQAREATSAIWWLITHPVEDV